MPTLTKEEVKAKMDAAFEHLLQEFKTLRTNRANTAMLDSVMVELYGASMRLKEVATIAVPEPRQLLVTPFDPKTTSAIAKGIEKANLNLLPIAEGGIVRVPVPPMDESVRKEIAKQAKKKAEDAKIAVREIRRKGNEQIRKAKTEGEVTEDVMKKLEKSIQELTDQYCKKIDDGLVAKEKEIMAV